MSQQELGPGIGGGRRRDLRVELVDTGREPGEQLKTLAAPLGRVRRQGERLQLGKAPLGPQRRAEGDAVVEGDGVQAILDHRAHADEPDAMGDERAQVARGRIGHPHGHQPR
jgi:hypothetical protein